MSPPPSKPSTLEKKQVTLIIMILMEIMILMMMMTIQMIVMMMMTIHIMMMMMMTIKVEQRPNGDCVKFDLSGREEVRDNRQ